MFITAFLLWSVRHFTRVIQNLVWIFFWRSCLCRKIRKSVPFIQGFSQLLKTRLDRSKPKSLHLSKVKSKEQMRNHITVTGLCLLDPFQDMRWPFNTRHRNSEPLSHFVCTLGVCVRPRSQLETGTTVCIWEPAMVHVGKSPRWETYLQAGGCIVW